MSIGVYAAIGAVILGLALVYAMWRNRTRSAGEIRRSEEGARALKQGDENRDAARPHDRI